MHGATTALIIAFTRSIIDGPPYFSIASEKQVVLLALDNPFTDPVADGFLQGKAPPPQGAPQGLPLRSTTNLTQSGVYQIQNANLGALAKDKVWLSCYDHLAAARAGRCRLASKAGRDWRALTVAGTGVNLSAPAKPNSQERPLRK